MSDPTTGWDAVPIYADWDTDPITNAPASGTVEFRLRSRINLVSGATIYPLGFKRVVSLDSGGSIATTFPAVDDPAIVQKEWYVEVTEKITGTPDLTYYIQPRLAHLDITPRPGLNLGTILVDQAQTQTPALMRGLAGGVAGLDADGDVIDARGAKVTSATSFLTLFANPRTEWLADTAYPAGSNISHSGGWWTATRAVPARTGFGAEVDGWWQTGWDSGLS